MTGKTQHPKEKILTGTPVSPGIAMGVLRVIARGFVAPEAYHISDEEIPLQLERFFAALERTKLEIQVLHDRINAISGQKEAEIFEAHLLFLEDKKVINDFKNALQERKQNAEAVFYTVTQNYLEVLRRVPDPYIREKTSDIEDLCIRILKNLEDDGTSEESENALEPNDNSEHILIAYDLTPSDTVAMDTQKVQGFATEVGSTNSHTAILARSMGIPAVVGINKAVLASKTLQYAILDGYKGELILDPTEDTIRKYAKLQAAKRAAFKELEELKSLPAETTDGHRIQLAANVEFPHEFADIQKVGAEGIGLFRTEFFLLGDNEIPDEDKQAEQYSNLIQGCAPHRVIFRTLDSGGDKLPFEDLDEDEPNPFLGWRGIRVSLQRPEIFRAQLKAILRASVHGPVGIMFPLVSGITEVKRAKAHLEKCKQELIEANIPIGKDIIVGVMIEVPSAAVISDIIAKEVDFFSIGTNDLTQYTIAVDRVNHRVARLFRTSHPAVIRLINKTIQSSIEAGIWTGVCGEVAADIKLLPLLIGMGAKELSVGVNVVPAIRYAIRHLSYKECQEVARKALISPDSNTILSLSENLALRSYPKLFK